MLSRAGLIEQGRQAQWRPCRLQGEPLKDYDVEPFNQGGIESWDRLAEELARD